MDNLGSTWAPAILAMLLSVLMGSTWLLCRSLVRRARQQERLSARQSWRLAADLAQAERAADLVQLARAEAGLDLRRTRLREVLQASLRRMAGPLAGVTLGVHEGGDPYIAADSEALGHALDRLLDQPRPAMQVRLQTDRTMAELSVDGGKADKLSLALVQRIIEGHRGEMRVAGESVTVRLPLVS